MCRTLYKRGFEPSTSQKISNEKSRHIASIGIQSSLLLNSVKNVSYFLFVRLPCVHFQPPRSLSTSKKKLEHITNINIWSYNLKFSEKTFLCFHFTALCYVQVA